MRVAPKLGFVALVLALQLACSPSTVIPGRPGPPGPTTVPDPEPVPHAHADLVQCSNMPDVDRLADCTGTTAALVGDTAFDTVADALDVVMPGETVDICPGEHDEDLLLQVDSVTLRGLDPDATVLTGGGAHPVLEIEGVGVVIEGLEISGGYTDGDGAGVLSLGELTVQCSTFSDNHAGGAGGAIAAEGTLTLQEVTMVGNSAELGGGVALGGDTEGLLRIAGGTYDLNQAASGGALAVLGSATASVFAQHATVTGNEAEVDGGGAWVSADGARQLEIVRGAWDDNLAGDSGGALSLGAGLGTELTVDRTVMQGNHADRGGAITLLGEGTGALILVGAVVSDNHASAGSGALHGAGPGVSLQCGDCDLGTEDVDNTPADVSWRGQGYTGLGNHVDLDLD